jgi:hypothetical protein
MARVTKVANPKPKYDLATLLKIMVQNDGNSSYITLSEIDLVKDKRIVITDCKDGDLKLELEDRIKPENIVQVIE